ALPLTRPGKLDVRALPDPAGGTPPQPSTTDRTSTGDRQSAPAETEPAGRSDGITATEQRVLNHWRQLLGAAEVGPNDDFFDQGGHSLLATRSAGLAAAIDALRAEAAGPGPESCFVCMGGRDARPPVFFIHPISGTVGCYSDLAQLLPDHLLVAVESPELRSGRVPPRSIPELAARYVAALRKEWPTGPCRLGGWSLGAAVSYEMAQQLAGAGVPVERLVMVEPAIPEPGIQEI